MLGPDEIAEVERRAAAARLTMGDLCRAAGVAASTWSRGRKRGSVRISVVKKIEDYLDGIEAQAAKDAA